MAKQKFHCKGVERASGRRVAVTLSADNKESAVRIAKEHGVLVESIVPAQEPKPAAPPAAAEDITEDLDEDVSGLLDWPDDEAEGLDLAGETSVKPPSPASPATKSCPYCGERVLAVAIRCKHCGSYLAEGRQESYRSVPAPPARMPWWAWAAVGGVVWVAMMWSVDMFPWRLFFNSSVPPTPAASSPTSTPSVQPAPPPPQIPKASPEERAYAAKLVAFLDGYDATTRLLETAPKPDEHRKQCEALKTLYAAIPPPPKGAPWAEEAAAASKSLLDLADMLGSSLTTLDEAMRAIGQSSGNSPESREACRQAAGQMRDRAATIRGLIPHGCLSP